jgi:hypothetical protein
MEKSSIDSIDTKKGYRIAISQDGKYAVTFDTGKFHFRKQICAISIIFFQR